MNLPTSTEPLSRLIELRQREIDRRSAELAEKLRLRERYQRNLAQLDALGTLCTLEPAHKARLQAPRQQAGALAGLALNSAHYKQSMQQLAASHRQDLALHEADLAVTRHALAEIAREREALQQLLTRQRQREQHERAVREQKGQDDLATQVWLRRSAA